MKYTLNIAILLSLSLLLINCSSKISPNVTTDETVSKGDNSMVSLDWNGTYIGTLPCADCEGIQTVIQIHNNLTYNKQTQYLGKSKEIFETSGQLSWDKSGSKITLDQDNTQYLVGENVLFKLDLEGNRIEGDLASFYQLKKANIELAGKKWQLVELNGQPIEANSKLQNIPFVSFTQEESRVSGNSGCNSFGGTYELKEGNRIYFFKCSQPKWFALIWP
ncbi:MAG: copper resistance protein NlpE N-terminal domain-containing protein [Chitinophagales bacterium]